jgi:hypothetical protein
MLENFWKIVKRIWDGPFAPLNPVKIPEDAISVGVCKDEKPYMWVWMSGRQASFRLQEYALGHPPL